MLKTLLICTALVGSPALAKISDDGDATGAMAGMDDASQSQMMAHTDGSDPATNMMLPGAGGGMMQMMQMMMGQMQGMGGTQDIGLKGNQNSAGNMPMMQGTTSAKMGVTLGIGGSPLTAHGQSAFDAIAEAVKILESDPDTDWSKVNIIALRQYLRDMDVVILDSMTVAEDIVGGVRFTVTGGPEVAPSITRIVLSFAREMDGLDDWNYSAEVLDNGVEISITVPESDLAKLKALGFYGVLASGPHHQPNHWAMTNGDGMALMFGQ